MAIQGEIVKGYLKKFPDTGTHQLCRKIYKENIEAFPNQEAVRSAVRYYRHARGDRKSKELTHIKDFSDFHKKHFGLPEGDQEPFEPYVLPKASKRILVLSDMHIPYHDRKAICEALEYGNEKQVDTIILNGDIMDCYALSKWVTDPRKRDMKYEIEVTKNFLKELREAFPKALIIFKKGNHERRWETFLKAKSVELFDINEFRLQFVLGLEALRIINVEQQNMIKAGSLNIVHGHELSKSKGSVNAARTFFLKAKASVLGGHFHQKSEHSAKDINGNRIDCYSTGCLCEMHPEYAPYNEWSWGFAYLRIINGKTWVSLREIL